MNALVWVLLGLGSWSLVSIVTGFGLGNLIGRRPDSLGRAHPTEPADRPIRSGTRPSTRGMSPCPPSFPVCRCTYS